MTESAILWSRQKCSNDGAEQTDDGRAFHAQAAVTEKARSLSVMRHVNGMTSVKVEALRRRQREPMSAVEWRVSARYDSTVPIRREHITRTEFSPELSVNVVHGEVELCAQTSLRRTQDEQRHCKTDCSRCNSCPEIPKRTELQ